MTLLLRLIQETLREEIQVNKILRLSVTIVLAFTLLFTTTAFKGCPSEKGIEKAAKTSLRLSDLTRDAIAATAKAYQANLISLETKDKMALQLDKVIAGGIAFNAAVKKANDEYKASGTVDTNAMRLLNSLLTSEVTTPFLAFLQLIGAVSSDQAPYLWAAINALRTALLLIGSFVSTNTVRMLNESRADDHTASVYENKLKLGESYLYVRKLC